MGNLYFESRTADSTIVAPANVVHDTHTHAIKRLEGDCVRGECEAGIFILPFVLELFAHHYNIVC
jgi:hypothetical protein